MLSDRLNSYNITYNEYVEQRIASWRATWT